MRKLLAAAASACCILLSLTNAEAAERIVFVGHWSESDSFFNVIRKLGTIGSGSTRRQRRIPQSAGRGPRANERDHRSGDRFKA